MKPIQVPKITLDVTEEQLFKYVDSLDTTAMTRLYNYLEVKLDKNKCAGVDKIGKRWRARVSKGKKTYNLGYFDTKPEAMNACEKKRIELNMDNCA